MKELKQKYERYESLQQEHARMCTRLELFEETKVAATKQLQQQHDQHMAALVQQNQEAFQKQEAVYIQHVQQLDNKYDALWKQHDVHTAAMVQQHPNKASLPSC